MSIRSAHDGAPAEHYAPWSFTLSGIDVENAGFHGDYLEIQGRRPEIEVVRLVGGSTAFVRRPFLYTGMLYGFGGALLACAIVGSAVLALLSHPVSSTCSGRPLD